MFIDRDDAVQKIKGSFIEYNNELVFVSEVISESVMVVHGIDFKKKSVPIKENLINFDIFKPGYYEVRGEILYVTRPPLRLYNRGITSRSILKYHELSTEEMFRIPSKKQAFDKFQDVLKCEPKKNEYRLSLEVKVQRKGSEVVEILFREEPVGVVVGKVGFVYYDKIEFNTIIDQKLTALGVK